MKITHLILGLLVGAGSLIGIGCLTGCSSGRTPTPESADKLAEFHEFYFEKQNEKLNPNALALYVDYSNCIAEGQHSRFFQGEYYEPTVTKGNDNNPYLAEAFKTWLKKGHDIFIFVEPYEELVGTRSVQKKRFYFLFTDQRLPDNIYNRVKQSVRLEDFPGTSEFHFSVRAPFLYSPDGKGMQPDELLSAKVLKTAGNYEVQDWEAGWEDDIEPMLVNAENEEGKKLKDGKPFETGLRVDRNSLGGYRIDRLTAKVSNVNQPYTDFCTAKEEKTQPEKEIEPADCEGFVKVDDKKFSANGIVELTFAGDLYNPDEALDGDPFNYTKIDLFATDISPMTNVYLPLFTFESLTHPGEQNVSVGASIEQCLINPEIKERILKTPIYTLYIKSNKR